MFDSLGSASPRSPLVSSVASLSLIFHYAHESIFFDKDFFVLIHRLYLFGFLQCRCLDVRAIRVEQRSIFVKRCLFHSDLISLH